jgi:hypothetical protein
LAIPSFNNQASFVPVVRREVEVSGLDQLVADSAPHLRVIPIEKRN